MNSLRQAAQDALEALAETSQWDMTTRQVNAVAALRAALAEPEKAEPVLYWHKPKTDDQEFIEPEAVNGHCPDCVPLYLHPPAERRPMTGEEAADLIDRWRLTSASCISLIREVERHHGVGETK